MRSQIGEVKAPVDLVRLREMSCGIILGMDWLIHSSYICRLSPEKSNLQHERGLKYNFAGTKNKKIYQRLLSELNMDLRV